VSALALPEVAEHLVLDAPHARRPDGGTAAAGHAVIGGPPARSYGQRGSADLLNRRIDETVLFVLTLNFLFLLVGKRFLAPLHPPAVLVANDHELPFAHHGS
jgi:hypothetical protein